MDALYLGLNILGIIVFLAIAWVFSMNRKAINYKYVLITIAISVLCALFFTLVPAGRAAVQAAADGFTWLVHIAYKGVAFGFSDIIPKGMVSGGTGTGTFSFLASSLMPFLLIVPLFDILTYVGVMPFIIKWLGRGLSIITGRPRLEAFFAVEMMFLGNTEALLVSRLQVQMLSAERVITLALMSMSCISASIVGSYVSMVPGAYVLTAIPLNIINAIIITTILNPVVVPDDEDFIVNANGTIEYYGEKARNNPDLPKKVDIGTVELDKKGNPKRPPIFSFLSDSILTAGKLILIVFSSVIGFVSLVYLTDGLLALMGFKWLSLENMFGIIFYPFGWLLGLDPGHVFEFSKIMGTKLVTNEFVIMGHVTNEIAQYPTRYAAILTTYITSFANFSTVGMIIGCLKGIVPQDVFTEVTKQTPRMLLSGVLVSLMTAGMVGLFVWSDAPVGM